MITETKTLAARYGDHIAAVKERHDRALAAAGASHAVIFSGAPKRVFLDDYDYPFKANPHFIGWLPLTDTPLSYLIYTPGEEPVLVYCQPQDYWHKPPATPDGYWTDYFDIRIIHELDEAVRHFPEARDKTILIGDIDDEAHAFGLDRVNPTAAMNVLHYCRSVKTDYEIECMRIATRKAVAGHRAAETAFRRGASEYEIHLDYCRATGHTENGLPYSNIVALNENGATLHYQHQERTAPQQLRSFLIDAGARCNGYAADITRTYAWQDGEFQDLINEMDRLQQDLCRQVRAGLDYRALHLAAHRQIAELLTSAGVTRGSADELIEKRVTAAFYPHGLGHLLGIQVHDVGGFMESESGGTIEPPEGHPFLRLTRPLQADQVLTVEPGIYFIDMLLVKLHNSDAAGLVNWDAVERLKPFGGIRIEDNVRVLANGVENLTRQAWAT